MRKQEQILSVIALVLLAGIILYHVLSSPLRYEVSVEQKVTTETVVAETTVSSSVQSSESSGAINAPPSVTQAQSSAPTASANALPGIDATGKVNLNTATLEDLKTLKGIGDSKAQAILDDRNENGPFSSIEDLTRVSGIGQKTFENLKDHITV